MTKIKNTKKGMAKKTLSISLAVAMLATSNVPVWAAEFTDGTDAAFTSEAVVETPVEEVVTDAPVVEEEKAEDASVITNEGDIVVSLEVDKTHATWVDLVQSTTPDTFNIKGTVTKKSTGATVGNWKYRWVDNNGNVLDTEELSGTTGAVAEMGFRAKKDFAGKTFTLHVYDESSPVQAAYDIDTKISVTVDAKKLGNAELSKGEAGYKKLTYTGFGQTVANPEIKVTDATNGIVDKDDYVVTTNTAIAAESKIKATVTAANAAYTGSVEVEVGKIEKVEHVPADKTNPDGTVTKKNIIAHTKAGQSYQYTGSSISIAKENVSLVESLSENNGDDTKLSGADLSKHIERAYVSVPKTGAKTGDLKVTVAVDDKFENINVASGTTIDTDETVKIEKRDLSTTGTKITVNTLGGYIPTGVTKENFVKYLSFTGVEGVDLSAIKNDTKEYTLDIKTTDGSTFTQTANNAKYKVTICATDAGNCKGEQTFEVTASAATLDSVVDETTYETFYTGSAIKPSKDDIGALKIKYYNTASSDLEEAALPTSAYEIVGYGDNTNATRYYDEKDGKLVPTKDPAKAYVTIKVLEGTYKGQTASVPFIIKPLEVKKEYVTVPSDVSYNKGYSKAEDYKVPVTVVAKNDNGKTAITLKDTDFKVEYEWKTTSDSNKVGNSIKTTVTVTNPNYILNTEDGKTVKLTDAGETKIVPRKLTDSMVVVTPDTYTYTGGKITPTYAVIDGNIVLYKEGTVDGDKTKAEYREVSITDAVNVGTGKITVEGISDGNNGYSGTAVGTFKITPANTNTVKVTIDNQKYTGNQVRPRTFTATLNGNDVSDQFEIVSFGENKTGKGTVVLKPVDGNKNFTGENITAEFNIVKEEVTAELTIRDDKGFDVTDAKKAEFTDNTNSAIKTNPNIPFKFDGNAKTFAKVLLSNIEKVTDDGVKTTAKAEDFEIKYADNVSGIQLPCGTTKVNVGYVYAVAKEGTGFAGTQEIITTDGVIKNVVAVVPFVIDSVEFVYQNVTLKNATYAAGLPVKPEILIQIGGSTLVEGKDYKVTLVDLKEESGKYVAGKEVVPTETTVGNIYGVKIQGINGYASSVVNTDGTNALYWGVDKKNLKDCTVTVKDGVVTITNGYLPVAATEYTAKNNNNGTYTITAEKLSKHYTGSVTVDAEGKAEDEKPDAPMIQSVKVVGNKATVVLSGETEGAVGYDYVISTDKDCINNKDYDKVNKNILNTTTDFTYVGQDVYYAYCHAWKRGEDGKKIFSDWSNAYPFVVSAITPSQPAITSVKVKGSTVTVTYTKSSNADGYDVVLGSKVATVVGEKRPVEYGTLVKKNIKGNTVTATFKNVKKGTYYAGLHAFNRTAEDGKKVFSPWSNVKRVTVK